MANSVLAAVHEAIFEGAANDVLTRDQTGAQAPLSTGKEEAMSKDNAPAGGDKQSGGITQAEHDAAVKAARIEGEATGSKAAADRLAAALGADGVKGDAGRMSAALDLAMKSPGMSGEDVAAFVVANVAQSKIGVSDYERQRLSAAGLAQPGGKPAEGTSGSANWAEFRAKRSKAK